MPAAAAAPARSGEEAAAAVLIQRVEEAGSRREDVPVFWRGGSDFLVLLRPRWATAECAVSPAETGEAAAESLKSIRLASS